MIPLALLLIGFSLFSALSLALTHFRREHYPEQSMARAMGLCLLLALSGLQVVHFAWLYGDTPWMADWPYRIALFAVAPAFYLFSRPLLAPSQEATPAYRNLGHGLPLLLAPALPTPIAQPLAFLVGAGYLAWLARRLYALRGERANFRREMQLLGGVFAIAMAIAAYGLGLGLLPESQPGKGFYSLYACAIGLAFFLVHTVLALRPQLSAEVQESAQSAYATTTLAHLDCPALLVRLEALMADEHLYRDPDLSLPGLAERLTITPHQLSELLNARLGKGFSRYLREQRIAAAKAMLLAEPGASVLAVGLNVGFTSQSNFYEAFRDIEGMPPGQFRKLKGNGRSEPAAA